MTVLLDTRGAAHRTGLARQTLAKLRCVGGGPPFRRLGAKVMYPTVELEAWIESHPLRRSTSDSDGTHGRRRAGDAA